MITITRERYTLKNARRCRESREYANVITRAIKSIKLESNAHVVMLIYNELNAKLQRNISMPELFTNIQNFLQCLDDKKKIWWTLTRRDKFSYEESQYDQFKVSYEQFRIFYQQNTEQFNQSRDQYDFQQLNQWKSSNLYRFSFQESTNHSNQNYSQSQLSERQLKLSKSRLQITARSNQASEFDSSKSNSFRSHDNVNSRFSQSSEQNQEEYDRSNRFFEKAWNQDS
jgi:hypothetical protein